MSPATPPFAPPRCPDSAALSIDARAAMGAADDEIERIFMPAPPAETTSESVGRMHRGRFVPAWESRLADRPCGFVLARLGARQDERNLRATARRALDLDGAARLTREAIDLGQAKPRVLRRVARREERLEGARRDLARHAGTFIADRDGDILARHDIEAARRLFAALDIAGGDGHRTAGRACFARILGQGEKRLVERRRIGAHRP